MFSAALLVSGSLALLFAAWFGWRGKYTNGVFLLIIAGVCFRIFVSMDAGLHPWDERYHALVAKNMVSEPLKPMLYQYPAIEYNYTDWTNNHVWIHKPPLPLWSMAASIAAFGNTPFAVRLPSVLLTVWAIWLLFLLGRRLFNIKVGFLSSFLFAINGLIIEITGGRTATDHIDVAFMVWILLAVYLALCHAQSGKFQHAMFTGIAIGAAILSKWLPALVVFPVWGLFLLHYQKRLLRKYFAHMAASIPLTLLMVLPWQIYIYSHFPAEALWESSHNLKHLTQVLDEQTGPWYYFLERITINYGEFILLPLIWFIITSFKTPRNKANAAIICWFIIPLIFFSIAQTKMQGYILFTAPALFLMTAAFFDAVTFDFTIQHKPQKILRSLIIASMIILPFRYSIERVKPFENSINPPEWMEQTNQLVQMIPKNSVIFNHPYPIEAMFFYEITAYGFIPDSSQLRAAQKTGRFVAILDENITIKERFNYD
jgi:4-amino-4-deoxy-L-arabinose transferase-like glycosyltransferase